MTREEAIKILKFQAGYFCDLKGCEEQQAFTMAIKALEQEPCEDAVSRQEILDYLDKMPSELTSDGRRMVRRRTLEEYISDTLPPVTPQQRTGRWTEDGHNLSDNWIFTGWKCSVCGKHAMQDRYDRYLKSNYCPNCGIKMVEPQEREE